MTQENQPRKKELIIGLVAQILNERELAINVGSVAGVTPGMKFKILAEKPIEIRDPVTKEVLDVVDREKIRVEASEIRQKMTICRTYREKQVPGSALWERFRLPSLDLRIEPPHTEPETLRASDVSLPAPLSPDDSYIKINDRVIEVCE